MASILARLTQERDNLLLGEVSALLHNLAKLDGHFVLAQASGTKDHSTFHAVPPWEDTVGIPAQRKEQLKKSNKNSFAWSDMTEPQKEYIRSINLDLLSGRYRLTEILAFWHHWKKESFDAKPSPLPPQNGFSLWLLGVCHGKAQVDKGEESNVGVQQSSPFRIASAFGAEGDSFVAEDLTVHLQQLQLPTRETPPLQARQQIVQNVKKQFRHGLGDTQRPINEITLWDWSWTTAALYKSALARLLLSYSPFAIDQIPASWKDPNEWKWRTLRISVDVLGLLAQGQRLPDVLGYQNSVQQLFDQAKELLEVESPLGNEVYRDSTGIYFTYPGLADDVPEKEDLERDICAAIRALPILTTVPEMMPQIAVSELWGERVPAPDDEKWADAPKMVAAQYEASTGAFARGEMPHLIPWQKIWSSSDPREVCPVCGIRPIESSLLQRGAYRKQRCSACAQRSQGAQRQWAKGEHFAGALLEGETIWLDEIADKHDRVALLVGCFHLERWLDGSMIQTLSGSIPKNGDAQLKQPSPARIMRVWRATEEFWTKSSRSLIQAYYDDRVRARRQVQIAWASQEKPGMQDAVFDGTINEMPISFYPKDGAYLTISNLDLCAGQVREGARVRVRAEDGPWLVGTITRVEDVTANQAMGAAYYPIRTILASPDQFLALMPGADALTLAQRIAQQYEREMGKVRSRLPMDLAIIYFHRKMPLYAVMDAARRFLNKNPREERCWKVVSTHQSGAMPITFTNGVSWDVPTTFGDGSPDAFYPYIGLWDKNAQGEYRANDRAYVHVNNLQPDQEVAVTPSHFSYLWLESSARRYAVGLPEDETPFGTQGMYLEEIAQLTEMWQRIRREKPAITDTQLHATVQLLMEKRQTWQDDAVFEPFAAAVLDRTGFSRVGITAADVICGRFFRCYDLHTRIMKQKLSDKSPSTDPKEEIHA